MRFFRFIGLFLGLLLSAIWLYCNSLIGVHPTTQTYYKKLQKELKAQGYSSKCFVISGRRWALDNYLLNLVGNAARKSKHLQGLAIDIIVLDVNGDGWANTKDIDIVYRILDRDILKGKGGLGIYTKEQGFFNRQMVHFDCREGKARWAR